MATAGKVIDEVKPSGKEVGTGYVIMSIFFSVVN